MSEEKERELRGVLLSGWDHTLEWQNYIDYHSLKDFVNNLLSNQKAELEKKHRDEMRELLAEAITWADWPDIAHEELSKKYNLTEENGNS